jgi:tRNA1Val (adenine37-N6)-methyltransferase
MLSFVTTHDVFLKGRLTIEQPKTGFRSGSDAVLLAAAAASCPFENALDVGSGAGVALLSLATLVGQPRRGFTGLERDLDMIALARRNAANNAHTDHLTFVHGNALAPPSDMLGQFDLVFSNPPFFDDDRAIRDPAPERQAAHVLGAPLGQWIEGLLALTAAKGRILVIHRAERLDDILHAFRGQAGDIAICPVRPRAGDVAKRVIVSARKGTRGILRLLAGIDMHPSEGDARFSRAYEAICDGGVLSV